MSVESISPFIIEQLQELQVSVHGLSASRNQCLVVNGSNKIYVFDKDGNQTRQRFVLPNSKVFSAKFTHLDGIAFTTRESHRVGAILRSDDAIKWTQMTQPECLTRNFCDDVIYLADMKSGVYQSTDGGVTWSYVFKSPDGWRCWQVIRVPTGTSHADALAFWALETAADDTSYRLRVYSVDKGERQAVCLTWLDVTIPSYVNINLNSRLDHDGETVFLTDYDDCAILALEVVSRMFGRRIVLPPNVSRCASWLPHVIAVACCCTQDTSVAFLIE